MKYIVKPNDTLSQITPNWQNVKTRSGNPNLIFPGEELDIPDTPVVAPTPVIPSQRTPLPSISTTQSSKSLLEPTATPSSIMKTPVATPTPPNPMPLPTITPAVKKVTENIDNVMQKALSYVPDAAQDAFKKNFPLIKKAFAEEGIDDPRVLAYALATVQHETASTFNPIEEYYGRQQAINNGYSGGEDYYGRGFIQLTHDYNYRDIGERIGMGDTLVNHPELALDPKISAKILAAFFKDRGVADYAKQGDFYDARGPVNGTDQADNIAGLANQYLKAWY